MAKIGRNEPCPCGSGAKYKKCCLNKQPVAAPNRAGARAYHWDTDEIRAFSTDKIIQKLIAFGVPFTAKQFLKDVHKFYSASEMSDSWFDKYKITARGFDEDFIWMAAIVLWERFAPDVVNSEMIDDLMQSGYETKGASACALWLKTWEHLKKRFTPDMRSVDDAEKVFSGLQSLFNWCQDLENELEDAAREDQSFYEKRIKYCQEFCELFPESDSLIIHNMKCAVAEAYFGLGKIDEGERAFKSLIEEFPKSAWAWIGWGDMYYLFRPNDSIPLDYERAKQIYETALGNEIDDKQDVIGRLAEMEKEHQKSIEQNK